MKQGNILDISYKAVQQSGKTNMFVKNEVQYWAHYLGCIEFVLWMQDINNYEYSAFQRSIDFSERIDIDTDYLLELDTTEAVKEFRMCFPDEVEEYGDKNGFEDFFPIPFTLEEYEESEQYIYEFLLDNAEEHPLNYLFISPRGHVIGKFKDDEWRVMKKIEEGEPKTEKLDAQTWKEAVSNNRKKMSADNVAKANIIDEDMRFAVLLMEK